MAVAEKDQLEQMQEAMKTEDQNTAVKLSQKRHAIALLRNSQKR